MVCIHVEQNASTDMPKFDTSIVMSLLGSH